MTRPRTIANHNYAPAANDKVAGDHVQPFVLDVSQLRGRIVRLNQAVDKIVSCHAYPEPVARLLAEALSLTALLAGMLKFDGIFTLQIKGSHGVKLMVCDLTTQGHLRGYASFDAETITSLTENRDTATPLSLTELCGTGYLAFTVDQKNAADRYQGIVELTGATLADAVRHYFHQSEQIKTGFEVAVGQFFTQSPVGQWHAAAIMLQQIAIEGGVESDTPEPSSDVRIDNWRRTMLLMNTASQAEMLDPHLPVTDVLYRLFHEEGVRIFPPLPIIAKCRCSRKKIAPIIEPLPLDEKRELAENGKITVTCEFCNKHYHFKVEPPVT